VVLRSTTFSTRVSVKNRVVGTLSVIVRFCKTVDTSGMIVGTLIVLLNISFDPKTWGLIEIQFPTTSRICRVVE
jgi:hypothetical protein